MARTPPTSRKAMQGHRRAFRESFVRAEANNMRAATVPHSRFELSFKHRVTRDDQIDNPLAPCRSPRHSTVGNYEWMVA